MKKIGERLRGRKRQAGEPTAQRAERHRAGRSCCRLICAQTKGSACQSINPAPFGIIASIDPARSFRRRLLRLNSSDWSEICCRWRAAKSYVRQLYST